MHENAGSIAVLRTVYAYNGNEKVVACLKVF